MATGDPKAVLAAASAGAALGNSAGKRINGISSTIGRNGMKYVKSGRAAWLGEEEMRKRAKENYIQNQAERDYVEQRLAGKNNGVQPSAPEINAEMEKRWELRETGITDNDIIDSAIDIADDKKAEYIENAKTDNYDDVEDSLRYDVQYKKDYDRLNAGKMEERDFNKKYGRNAAQEAQEHYDINERADKISFNQASYAAQLANQYSKSEFRDEKKMASLQKTMVDEYMQQTNSSKEHATRIVNNSITDAAKIKGVETPNIPGAQPRQTNNNQQNGRTQQTNPRQTRATATSSSSSRNTNTITSAMPQSTDGRNTNSTSTTTSTTTSDIYTP